MNSYKLFQAGVGFVQTLLTHKVELRRLKSTTIVEHTLSNVIPSTIFGRGSQLSNILVTQR